MTVRHPAARANAAPAAYTFGSETYPVRDGAIVCPTAIEEDVAAALAERYGMDAADLLDGDDAETPTCSGADGDCSREVEAEGDRCWQHDDAE